MKKILLLVLLSSTTFLTGCRDELEKKADPSFSFFCFRKEIVSKDFHVPDMKDQLTLQRLQHAFRSMPGYVKSEANFSNQTLTITYQSSAIRYMNFEEAIALNGFSVNSRPAKKQK